MRVVNHTTPLQSRYGGEPIMHRLTLQENHHNQRVLLQVEGNVPEYNLSCKRWCILYCLSPTYCEEAATLSVGYKKKIYIKKSKYNQSYHLVNYQLDCVYSIGFIHHYFGIKV